MANKNFDGMEQPSWYDGKTIDEVAFCASFLRQHPMKCIRWRLFTVDGLIEDEGKIQQMILDEVMSCQSIGIAKKVKSLFDTKEQLSLEEIHCHHKTPKSLGGGDDYANLIILHERIHRLVHATQKDTISAIMQTVQFNKQQLEKLNKLRKLAGNEAITFEQQTTCC